MGVGIMAEGGQKVQSSTFKINKLWHVVHSMATIVNNSVLRIWELLKEETLKFSLQEKKSCNYVKKENWLQ